MNKEIETFSALVKYTKNQERLENMKTNLNAALLTCSQDRRGNIHLKINIIKNRINELINE